MLNCPSANTRRRLHFFSLFYCNRWWIASSSGQLSLKRNLWYAWNINHDIPRSGCATWRKQNYTRKCTQSSCDIQSKIIRPNRASLDFIDTCSHFLVIVVTGCSCVCFVKKFKTSVRHRPFCCSVISIYLSANPSSMFGMNNKLSSSSFFIFLIWCFL